MAVVVVAAEKGGVGKTTLATNLAIMRAREGWDVLVVDADPQGSSQEFFYVREAERIEPTISCVSITGKALAAEVRKLAPRYQDIVIDCGGRDSAGLRSALLVAETLIVPFLPGQYDLWALESINDLIGDAQGLNPVMRVRAVMNKADTNPHVHIGDEAAELVGNCKNMSLLRGRLCYRVAYRRSSAEGRAVVELAKADAKALSEMDALYDAVYGGDQK